MMKRNLAKVNGDLLVGLDCSTTSTKAIAYDRNGRIAEFASKAIPLHSPQPNYYEQDPKDWWRSAQRALREITWHVNPGRITALAISNQRETFVALDTEGNHLRPAIVWLDERCKDEVDAFAQKIGKSKIHRITGKPPDYAPVVYRLAWMKKHEPNLFGRIGVICDVNSYLVWKLTGSFKTSWASADPLGLFDIRNKKWSPPILAALNLHHGQLPETFKPGTVLGTISQRAAATTGLNTGTLIVAGGGDGQAAGLGSNVVSPRRAYLNLGTAVVAGIYGSRCKTDKAFRTMCSCSDTGYYYESSLRAGTFTIDWLIRKVLKIDPTKKPGIYRELEREAHQVPIGSDGLFHLPYLSGVMNPYWDIDARGAFVGLSSSHTRGHIYRAILEGIAFEEFFAVGLIEKAIGTRVGEFVAIGGGASNELWCSIIADVTGKRVLVPGNVEASSLGAAIAAAVGAGWYRTFAEAATEMTGSKKEIRPNLKNHELYSRLFESYKEIYPALKRIGIDS
jgi:sugar (pentulose or hexulose) kinase